MEKKLFDKNSIVLDGRLDEAVWAEVPEYTDFKMLKKAGGQLAAKQTIFKILPCEDRIYVGVKCLEPDRAHVLLKHDQGSFAIDNSVEIFLSPIGKAADFYQFAVTQANRRSNIYYEEAGNIKPDRYAPVWNAAVYEGEDFWSVEVEFPLTAFYNTPYSKWSDKWLVNVTRNGFSVKGGHTNTTWAPLSGSFLEPFGFQLMEGFPIRPIENDVCISAVRVDLMEKTETGYTGTLTAKATVAVDCDFEFSTTCSEPVKVSLAAGSNEISVPCAIDKLGRVRIGLELKRISDGYSFKRFYPALVVYEPLKLTFTLPEYRGNFYPGQDYTKVVGKATSAKRVTLKLEGPGIETQTVVADAEGNFAFDTANFEDGGVAMLTATIDGYELTKKIRRVAQANHTMSWISGGNLIVNGKPVLYRRIWAEYYRGGEAFRRRYDADDLHQTLDVYEGPECFQPLQLIRGSEKPGGEALRDAMPSEQALKNLEERMEACKDQNFSYYYISDEPDMRGVSPIYLKHLYEYMAEKDPTRVVMMATLRADEYLDAADWFTTHPYISPYYDEGERKYGRQFNSLGAFVDKLVQLNRPDKAMGFVPTCYCAKQGDYPTFVEYVGHTWAAMMRGANGVSPYAYHDMNDRPVMYEGTRYLFTTFEALEDMILFAVRRTLLKTSEVEAVRYDYNGKSMFVLVNLTTEPQHVVLDGIDGTWHEFRHNRTISSNVFDLYPFQTVIGTSEVMDAGLPTYEETEALIDKLEYERTHRGSLLFNRSRDITVKTSGVNGWVADKLFDGVQDDLACYLNEEVESKFMELGVAKINPTFTKVVVHGWHTEGVKLLTGRDGELAEAPVAEVQNEEFSTTLILKEAVNADMLRFEFPGKGIELYEIELF